MASSSNEQDLLPDQTEGFKVGEKKTMDEYNKLGMWLSHFPVCYSLSLCLFSVLFGYLLVLAQTTTPNHISSNTHLAIDALAISLLLRGDVFSSCLLARKSAKPTYTAGDMGNLLGINDTMNNYHQPHTSRLPAGEARHIRRPPMYAD